MQLDWRLACFTLIDNFGISAFMRNINCNDRLVLCVGTQRPPVQIFPVDRFGVNTRWDVVYPASHRWYTPFDISTDQRAMRLAWWMPKLIYAVKELLVLGASTRRAAHKQEQLYTVSSPFSTINRDLHDRLYYATHYAAVTTRTLHRLPSVLVWHILRSEVLDAVYGFSVRDTDPSSLYYSARPFNTMRNQMHPYPSIKVFNFNTAQTKELDRT